MGISTFRDWYGDQPVHLRGQLAFPCPHTTKEAAFVADTATSPLLDGADFAAAYHADDAFHTSVKRGDHTQRAKHRTEAAALAYIGLEGGSPDPSHSPEPGYVRIAINPTHRKESHHV
jgi:hypothetical protein